MYESAHVITKLIFSSRPVEIIVSEFNNLRMLQIALYIIDLFWYIPLYRVYRKGPTFRGMGFWGSLSDEDVCSRLTGTNSAHWKIHNAECVNIIQEDFQQWVVLIDFGVYAYTTLVVASTIMHIFRILICNYFQILMDCTCPNTFLVQ